MTVIKNKELFDEAVQRLNKLTSEIKIIGANRGYKNQKLIKALETILEVLQGNNINEHHYELIFMFSEVLNILMRTPVNYFTNKNSYETELRIITTKYFDSLINKE